MISRLEIKNFRGLRNVVLDDLRNVNLIVGGNDTGKTSVLEALTLLLGDSSALHSLSITFRTNESNGPNDQNDRENFWTWLFFDKNSKNYISLVANLDAGDVIRVMTDERPAQGYHQNAPLETVMRRIDHRKPATTGGSVGKAIKEVTLLQFGENQFSIAGGASPDGVRVAVLSTRPTNPTMDAENYNQVALLADGERRVEQVMREIEPRLKRLRYAKLPRTTGPLVFADVGLSRAVPSTQMGQAFNRILHIYTQVLAHRTNVLLVDEIENGIFSESMPIVWRGLMAICEQEGVQIFATTHSRECVMAANAVAHERDKDELCVQRLQLVNNQVEAVRLGAQHLDVAAEMGLEVRS